MFWTTPWKPTHEEKLSFILSDCNNLKNHLLSWEKKNFIIAYCPKKLIIYIFVEGDMGFNIEGWKFFNVETFNNCGSIDVLTYEPLADKILYYDSRIPVEGQMDLSFLEDSEFNYKDTGLIFEAVDMGTWLCREKRMWLICSFGNWKTSKFVNNQTVYKDYDSFEQACDAILNS